MPPDYAGYLTRIIARDEGALNELYKLTRSYFRYIIRKTGINDADVDDALVTCWLEVWNTAHKYDPTRGPILTWLIILFRHRAISFLRKSISRDNTKEKFTVQETLKDQDLYHAADHYLRRAEICSEVKANIATLSLHQQNAIYLVYYRGLTMAAAANEAGVPKSTMKTRIDLAIKNLRRKP